MIKGYYPIPPGMGPWLIEQAKVCRVTVSELQDLWELEDTVPKGLFLSISRNRVLSMSPQACERIESAVQARHQSIPEEANPRMYVVDQYVLKQKLEEAIKSTNNESQLIAALGMHKDTVNNIRTGKGTPSHVTVRTIYNNLLRYLNTMATPTKKEVVSQANANGDYFPKQDMPGITYHNIEVISQNPQAHTDRKAEHITPTVTLEKPKQTNPDEGVSARKLDREIIECIDEQQALLKQKLATLLRLRGPSL